MQALSDIRVADFTQLMAGGWATQKLGDMGAEVIKIERPGGETQRTYSYRGQLLDGEGIGYLAMNRNKRSVVLDLKTDDGHEAVTRIIETADVLAHNFRPGVMSRLGLSYDDVQAFNEDIVYLHVSGYGSSGPYAERPGQDLIYQAISGLTSYTGRDGDPPTPAGTVVVDEHTATLAAMHTVEALFHRERTGEGQKVEVSLFNAAIDMQCNELTYCMNMGEALERGRKTHGHPYLYPPYGVYETADGHVAIGMAPIDHVGAVLELEGLDGYDSQTELFADRDEIHDRIEAKTSEYRTDDLVEVLVDADIQANAVQPPTAIEDHPQAEHNEMIVELAHPRSGTFKTTGTPARLSKTPHTMSTPPPVLGGDTEAVLMDVGYEPAEVDDLVATGAANRPEPASD